MCYQLKTGDRVRVRQLVCELHPRGQLCPAQLYPIAEVRRNEVDGSIRFKIGENIYLSRSGIVPVGE